MKLFIYYFILVLLFFSCSNKFSDKSIVGTWNYDNKLFLEEQKQFSSPKANLSEAFDVIKMVFTDNEFTSYLDKQVTIGKWKIEKDSLSMFLDNHGWKNYFYKLSNNNLIIYDRDFIIALKKEK
ncbi:MAG: hypothetical protein CMG66_06140 [Candidatus Marinimicrobia bacterium]|nr:hypothetical protein [Candidatus Neomarinimicrobiota bacterium]|tara:strand:+ start:16812 stop:17183 length:372 start_codon:yes stop_codon:yes gene_type:complete